MQKKWLIDGNNLMHKIPGISSKISKNSDEARFLLVEMIHRFCSKEGRNARIIFDGPKGSTPISFKHISIGYSRDKKADDIIIKQLNKKDARQRWIVVTDDREIVSQAKIKGVNTLSINVFKKNLSGFQKGSAKSNKQQPIEKGSNIIVSDAEVNEMLLFYKLKESDERNRSK